MLEAFVNTFFRGYLWIFLAAISGIIYLAKVKNVPLINRIFVWFLWFTLFVDLSGFYSLIAYYSDYRYFSFVNGTKFVQNYWLYNIFKTVAFIFYFYFFIFQLKSTRLRKIMLWITWIFFISAWINYYFFMDIFMGYSLYTAIGGTFILLTLIGLYLYQIIRSNEILDFYRELPFYVATGALLWHITITPLFIFNQLGIMYSSEDFVRVYLKILTIMNFIMYGFFAVGFLTVSFSRRYYKAKKTGGPETFNNRMT